jgi:putative endonuclease
VEVKARQLEQVALDSVRLRQQLRIAQAAQAYLSQRPDLIAKGVRFDIVTFGGSLLPRHLPGAFHPEDWRRRDA